MNRRAAENWLLAALLFVALPAKADPAPPEPEPTPIVGAAHIASASTVHTDGGSVLRLPPGYFSDEDNWHRLDVEMRRLQDAETQLRVENKTLRASMETWQPGWKTLVLTLATGVAAGWYVHSKL